MDKKTYEALKKLIRLLDTLNWSLVPKRLAKEKDLKQLKDFIEEMEKEYLE